MQKEEDGWKQVGSRKKQTKIQKERPRSYASKAPEERCSLASLVVDIRGIDGQALTREAAMEFNEADVRKPMASAACVAKAVKGMWLDENRGYIQNVKRESA